MANDLLQASHSVGPVLLRYMGTKRHIAHRVRRLVDGRRRGGHVLDLFSGMGSVAASLAPDVPVTTNDALTFTTAFARARFLELPRPPVADMLAQMTPTYDQQHQRLMGLFAAALVEEEHSLDASPDRLRQYMCNAPHVGNSDEFAQRARDAASSAPPYRHQLATLYYSGGYFGVRQSIELDSIRAAIDALDPGVDRNWLLAAWLSAAATVINAPGHTAQFLKPTDEGTFKRIKRFLRRSPWQIFADRLMTLMPVGTAEWRRQNRVCSHDALEFLSHATPPDTGLIYADPPYTRDHYSRYYHVYETLYRYDFPASTGIGRYPDNRFLTAFCVKTAVAGAFGEFLRAAAHYQIPLVLSYPSNGLLFQSGADLEELITAHFTLIERESFENAHSTLGASKGSQLKLATENLYVCVPK